MSKKNRGSSLDNFLKEEGTYDQDQALAIKEVIVWQLTEAMQEKSLSKARLAAMLGTSRSQVDRLLDPTRDVMLSTLQRLWAEKCKSSWSEPARCSLSRNSF
jgi:antitoxin HicB